LRNRVDQGRTDVSDLEGAANALTPIAERLTLAVEKVLRTFFHD